MNQQFRNITFASDKNGTFCWRRSWPINSLNCISQAADFQSDYTQTPIFDQNFYKGMTSVTVQRWISTAQRDMFCKFLKPLMDANQGYLIYEIDDNMSDKYIPKFNRGRKAFEGAEIQANIKEMLNVADFVTVTTDYIKEFYHKEYSVPLKNIIALPNLLPRYLFADRYRPELKLDQFRKFKTKPRIGIVSSLSHYNIDNVRQDKDGLACRLQEKADKTKVWINEKNVEVPYDQTMPITDDFDEICDCVRQTVNDVQWVMFGYCPPKVKDLADAHKIEVHGGVPIMNYASTFDNLKLQAIVAAIKPMEFNYCKSFIKFMECAALGVPCYATRCLPYDRVMPNEQLFSSSDELKEKLLKLKFMSSKIYQDIIERQWQWLNRPCHEGDFDLKNFWLEDNLNIHIDLNRLRSKTLKISLTNFIKQYEARKKKEAEATLFKNENIQILK